MEQLNAQLQSNVRQAMSKVEQALENCQGQLDILHTRFAGIEELSSSSGGKTLAFISELETCTKNYNVLEKKMNLHIDFAEVQFGEIKHQLVVFKTDVAEAMEQRQKAHETLVTQIETILDEWQPESLNHQTQSEIFKRLDQIESNNKEIIKSLSESGQKETRWSRSSRIIPKLIEKMGQFEKDLEMVKNECRVNLFRSETSLKGKIRKLRKLMKFANSTGVHSKSTCK